MYAQSDGNGGVVIHKGLLAVLTFVLVLLTTFASVVAYSAGVKADVQYNAVGVEECRDRIGKIISRVDETEQSISSVDTDIENIKEDLREIKADVKVLLQQTGGDSP